MSPPRRPATDWAEKCALTNKLLLLQKLLPLGKSWGKQPFGRGCLLVLATFCGFIGRFKYIGSTSILIILKHLASGNLQQAAASAVGEILGQAATLQRLPQIYPFISIFNLSRGITCVPQNWTLVDTASQFHSIAVEQTFICLIEWNQHIVMIEPSLIESGDNDIISGWLWLGRIGAGPPINPFSEPPSLL